MSNKYYIIIVKYLKFDNIYFISGVNPSFNITSYVFEINVKIERALIFDSYDIHKMLDMIKIDFKNDNVKITKKEVVL